MRAEPHSAAAGGERDQARCHAASRGRRSAVRDRARRRPASHGRSRRWSGHRQAALPPAGRQAVASVSPTRARGSSSCMAIASGSSVGERPGRRRAGRMTIPLRFASHALAVTARCDSTPEKSGSSNLRSPGADAGASCAVVFTDQRRPSRNPGAPPDASLWFVVLVARRRWLQQGAARPVACSQSCRHAGAVCRTRLTMRPRHGCPSSIR